MATGRRNGGRTEEKGSPPIWTKRIWTGAGTVECSVFDRMVEGNDGEYRVFNTVVKRTWKDGDEYKSGNSFRVEDLLWVAAFLNEAALFIANESAKR